MAAKSKETSEGDDAAPETEASHAKLLSSLAATLVSSEQLEVIVSAYSKEIGRKWGGNVLLFKAFFGGAFFGCVFVREFGEGSFGTLLGWTG